jgi:hypothetical protein
VAWLEKEVGMIISSQQLGDAYGVTHADSPLPSVPPRMILWMS